MKILNFLRHKQPDVIEKLELIGFDSIIEEEEPDYEFEYFDKLMKEIPKP